MPIMGNCQENHNVTLTSCSHKSFQVKIHKHYQQNVLKASKVKVLIMQNGPFQSLKLSRLFF